MLAPWGRGALEWGGIFDSTSRSRLLEIPYWDARDAEVALTEIVHFISDNSTKENITMVVIQMLGVMLHILQIMYNGHNAAVGA